MTKFHLPDEAPKKAKPAKLHERESDIENYLVRRVAAQGGVAYKFTSPQRRSVPDRLVLGDAKGAAQVLERFVKELGCVPSSLMKEINFQFFAAGIAAAMIHFVELKATGQKPTELQQREHERLRARGFVVKVIDSKELVDKEYPK